MSLPPSYCRVCDCTVFTETYISAVTQLLVDADCMCEHKLADHIGGAEALAPVLSDPPAEMLATAA